MTTADLFPRCETCQHAWHGLPCQATKSTYDMGAVVTAKCNCQSPFDDDYWTGDAA